MLPLALIADMWILVVGLVGMYLLLAPIAPARVPAFAVTVVHVKVGNLVVSYGRKREYYGYQATNGSGQCNSSGW